MSLMNISAASSRNQKRAFDFAAGRNLMAEWWQRLRSRYELESLGAESLRDIGLSSGEAKFEASKPFWRA